MCLAQINQVKMAYPIEGKHLMARYMAKRVISNVTEVAILGCAYEIEFFRSITKVNRMQKPTIFI